MIDPNNPLTRFDNYDYGCNCYLNNWSDCCCMISILCCNTDEAATEQLRAWATEILSYNNKILNGENHELENGETKVDDEEKKPEEVSNKIDTTQVQQDGIGIELKREVEVVKA